jgi:WD40 repeat protein
MSASFDILAKMPFPGLRSYEPAEKEMFFGRDRQLDELLRKIRSNRFLAVVGNSGSGKSSLVKASLVPKLQEGFAGQAGQNWRIAICNPGNNPIANLATQLAQRNVLHSDDKMDPNYPAVLENTLRRGSLGIVEAYKSADVDKENLIIIIDQFEEIFRFSKKNAKNQEDAATYVNLLLNASRQRDVPIYIILTMRSSFIGNCTDFRGLPEAINDGQFLIPRMKTEELKKVIISPIKATGASIDPELVTRMISDMGEDFDDLPVLQHTLLRSWDNWVEDCDPNQPLGIKHYEAVGGIKKAMSIHAEEAYRGLDTRDKQIVCERMFRALCEKGADGNALRRPATVREIMQVTGMSLAAVVPVITTFSRPGRLFLSAPEASDIEEDSSIYIAHESLISKWDRLSAWSDEEYESADMYQRMSAAAALYMEGKGGLWHDPELSLGLKWFDPEKYDSANPDRLQPNIAWAQRYNNMFDDTIEFLKKSEAALNKKDFAEKEDADRKKRTRALIMYLSLGFGVICLILLLLAGVALESARRSAVMAGRKEKEARLAAYQAELAKQDAAGKEFLALTSAKRADQERLMAEIATEKAIESAEIAQQKSLDARRSEAKALVAFDSARAAMAKAERERLKALEKERMANEQKDIADAERMKAIKTKGLSLAQSVAVKSWKVEDPDVQALLAQESFGINKASEGRSNDAYIYEALYKATDKMNGVKDNPDFNTLSIAPEGLDHIGAVRSIVVSSKQDERDLKVYTTGSDGWLLKWNLQTFKGKEDRNKNGRPEEIARNRNDRVYRSMDMSPDGKYLVRGGDEEYIEVFDVAKKERKLTIDAHRGRRVWALEFLPDGNAVVSAGDDGSIKYSNLKGQVTPIVEGLSNRITSISLSGDGQHIAGAGNSPAASIWNIKSGQEEFKLDNPYNKQNATAVSISPAGRFVAVGYQDGALLIWDIYEYIEKRNEYKPERLLNHSAGISDIAFSDDGTSLIVGSLDKRATLWQVWDKKYEKFDNEKEFPFKDPKFQPIRLEDHSDWVLSVAFSHDGKKALTGCADGTVKIYEVEMARYAEQMCDMVRKNLSNKDWKKYIGTDDPEKDPRKQKLFIITADGQRTPLTTCGSDFLQESDNK